MEKKGRPPAAKRRAPTRRPAAGREAEVRRQLAEALEQQAAVAEVLGVMSRRPGELQPVADTVMRRALALCDAEDVLMLEFDGDLLRGIGHIGVVPYSDSPMSVHEAPPAAARAILERKPIHIPDVVEYAGEVHAEGRRRAIAAGVRTALGVPLLRQGLPIGAIILRRQEVRPFSDRQIRLLETFADQAAIAIENARLFNETKEALERQTAVADVLQAISGSVFDLDQVLGTITARAMDLCGAASALLLRVEGDQLIAVVRTGALLSLYDLGPGSRMPLDAETLAARSVRTLRPESAADPRERPEAPQAERRSRLAVPIVRDDQAWGTLVLTRAEPVAFNDREIQLVRTFADQAAIAIENVRLFNETKESLERQTATAEILEVINRSPGDLRPVFEAVVEAAKRLLRSWGARMELVVEGEMETVALSAGNIVPPTSLGLRQPISEAEVPGRAILERRTVHVPDVSKDPRLAQRAPWTRLAVPILRASEPLGAIAVGHNEVRPFTPHEIELLETFAGQVAIAIENARLFNETKEALEQQTATSEVLEVISRSTGDLGAVFEKILDMTLALCEADNATAFIRDGERFRGITSVGYTPEEKALAAAAVTGRAARPRYLTAGRGTIVGRVALERATVQIVDPLSDPEYADEIARSRSRFAGVQQGTHLGVPLVKDGEVVGVIIARRREVRAFSDRQVAVLESFARQAAIAVENVRLFNETREALERQTAIAEILRAISASPTDVQPVLDAIVESAARFCAAEDAAFSLVEGQVTRIRAHHGQVDLVPRAAYPIDRSSVSGRALLERRTIAVEDLQAEAAQYPMCAASSPTTRAILAVPLLRMDEALGVIFLRRTEKIPFTAREIELAETFADQAAIAIENVRLFNETKEGLERQTAVSEVLASIGRSAFDLPALLDTVIERAARLCRAPHGVIYRLEGGALTIAAGYQVPEELRTLNERVAIKAGDRGSLSGRVTAEGRPVRIDDVLADPDYVLHEHQRAGNLRSMLGVPLLGEGSVIGVMSLWRPEPIPFTDGELGIVTTFADQAAIAIENVRLFNETKAALERQTATAEILRLIAASPTDVQPVLDGIADSTARFCSAENVTVALLQDGQLRAAAAHGPLPGQRDLVWEADRASVSGRAVVDGRTIHVVDLLAESENEYSTGKAIAREFGHRTVLAVPLLREGVAIGALLLRRDEVRAFTPEQIELVETFASQAVIAIENVRLFNETRDALARQTAIADVMGTISRSVFDLNAILTTVIQNAVKLCSANGGLIFRREGDDYRLEAMFGGHPAFIEYFKERVLHPGSEAVTMRAVTVGEPVQIADVGADPDYEHGAVREFEPFRTVLGIPLLHQGKPIGAMSLWRNEVREFSPAEIDLVRTFADQAAIAIENVRLFNETKEALEQQTATSEVLRVISRSTFDVQPVLDAVVQTAGRLARADAAWMRRVEGGGYVPRSRGAGAHWGATPEIADLLDGVIATAPPPDPGLSIMGLVWRERRTIHVEDVSSREDLRSSTTALGIGARTVLAVPLMRQGEPIGFMVLARARVEPFSERETALVETFADQAAIAIENVRLFNEIQEKSAQLEAASRHKSEFLANMSHELRTPLNAIIGFSDVLLSGMFGELTEKQREYLGDVHGSGQHLLSLINDILDLSKIEAGRMELALAPFSLRAALENGVTMVRERAGRQRITLSLDVAAEVEDIVADERKVKQVVYNLLSNAVKFTPEGGRVDVRAERRGDEVVVSVRDTGIGIEPEDRDRIFEEFHQAGRDPERSREGTGLGLTLSRRFVELHGGRIDVESVVGRGSTFTFSLPIRQPAAVAE